MATQTTTASNNAANENISTNDRLSKSIDKLAKTLSNKTTILSTKITDHASFDKTYNGVVVDKYFDEKDSSKQLGWVVAIDSTTYNITSDKCNISSVGQDVKVFIPNRDYSKMYAEVIDTTSEQYLYNHPSKAVFDDNANTITETWALADGTQVDLVYTLTIENEGEDNEEVTNIEFPDGTNLSLEGFATVIG